MTDEINKRFDETMNEAEQISIKLIPIFEGKTINAITMGVALSFEAFAEINDVQKEKFYADLLGARKLIHCNQLLKQDNLMLLAECHENFQLMTKHILKRI